MVIKKLKAAASAFVSTGVTIEMTVHRRLPADHPIHALVGRVASEWAHVEHLLDLIIWQLAKVEEPIGACLTGQMLGSFARITAIQALCINRKLGPEIIKKVQELSKKMKGSQDRRNRILHDAWYVGDTTGLEQYRSMARDEFESGFKPIDEDYLKQTLEKISRRVADIHDLRNAITAAT
jgi:hypothetical protein